VSELRAKTEEILLLVFVDLVEMELILEDLRNQLTDLILSFSDESKDTCSIREVVSERESFNLGVPDLPLLIGLEKESEQDVEDGDVNFRFRRDDELVSFGVDSIDERFEPFRSELVIAVDEEVVEFVVSESKRGWSNNSLERNRVDVGLELSFDRYEDRFGSTVSRISVTTRVERLKTIESREVLVEDFVVDRVVRNSSVDDLERLEVDS
jgi:hypothetical protein